MKKLIYSALRKTKRLLRKVYSVPNNIVDFALKAKRSKYSFNEKIKVFRFLLSNYLGREFSVKNRSEISQNIFDFKVTAYDYHTLNYLFKEIFLSNEYYFDTSKSDPKIIDCGANIGMSILFFKKLYPTSSIIAFEPNPYAFQLLEKNIKQNDLTNIQLFNIGLSNINGEIDFFMNNTKGTLKGSFISERGGENKIIVETQKLSKIINTNVFDLIKIDIEGAEIQVIEDLISEGKINQINQYLIEYHHRINGAKSDFSVFIKHFEDNNYEYNIRTGFTLIGDFQDVFLNVYKD